MVSTPQVRAETPKRAIAPDEKDTAARAAKVEIPGVESLVSAGKLKRKPNTLKAELLGETTTS